MEIIIKVESWAYGIPGYSRELIQDGHTLFVGPGPDYDRYAPPHPRRQHDYQKDNACFWVLTQEDALELSRSVKNFINSNKKRDKSLDSCRKKFLQILSDFTE